MTEPALPDDLALRPVRDDDIDAIVTLINDDARATVGFAVADAALVRRRWLVADGDPTASATTVVAPDGRLAGFLHVGSDPPHVEIIAIGATAPAFHGRGVGAALLAETERRAASLMRLAAPGTEVVLHVGMLAGAVAASALATAAGFVEVRRFWRMHLVFGDPLPPATVPPGVELRPFVTGRDDRAVFAAEEESFADHWGTTSPDYEGWRRHAGLDEPDFDPSLWTIAWAARADGGEEIAGILLASTTEREDATYGYVSVIGVLRPHRGRGLAQALLLHAFAALRERGRAGVALHVDSDSPTGATRLYERVGMTPQPRFVVWAKTLREGAR